MPEVAKILRGKHKPIFAPHADTGDHVIVVNARGIRLTGGKEEKKIAYLRVGAIDPKTPSQLADALGEVRDANGLILDLRWCPGGFLNPSAEIAGLFITPGPLTAGFLLTTPLPLKP